MTDTEAAKIVDAIVADLSDRRGLRQAWEGVDAQTRREIKAAWAKIVQGGSGR